MQCPIICIHKQGCQNLMKLGIYIVHMALLQEIESFFFIWASTSGVKAPPGAEASPEPFNLSIVYKANCYAVLRIFYLPFISKVHYK